MKKLLILVLFAFVLASCNRLSKSESSDENHAAQEMQIALPPVVEEEALSTVGSKDLREKISVSKALADTSKKIIKNGEISFETSDVQKTRKAIVAATKNLDGYISSETESGFEDDRKEYTLDLKVPAKNFDALLQAISTAADKIDSKNIRIHDVTAEYVDTKTRLHNKKVLERRYLELLNKASKITDMLSIEDKLSEIRTEIESIEAQFLAMQNKISYSSISLTFYSKSIVSETGKGFLYQLGEALEKGWDFMQTSFFALLSVWPLLLLIMGIYWWARKYRKNRRKLVADIA